jgi:hypothetical protein
VKGVIIIRADIPEDKVLDLEAFLNWTVANEVYDHFKVDFRTHLEQLDE